MSKNKLFLDFDYDFVLISIISSIRDYRLCWQLNKRLSLDFIRQEDIEIHNKNLRQLAYFNLFLFDDEINFVKYFFITNKSSGINLIPEMKQVDYFLMIKGAYANDLKNNVTASLSNINNIEAHFVIDPYRLKSKQNLIFE